VSAASPVFVLAGVIAYHLRFLSKVLHVIQNIDVWMRTSAGTLFIVLGIYLTIRHNFTL